MNSRFATMGWKLPLIGAVACAAQMSYATTILSESFSNATLLDPTSWVLSRGTTSVAPCLTAASSTGAGQPLAVGTMKGCQNPSVDSAGAGALRLTATGAGESGMLLYNTALPTSGGLDVAFSIAQYGGSGADGLVFFVKDGADANTTPGVAGGSLGYALGKVGSTVSGAGIHAGLFGVGFDKWGNYSATGSGGPGCGANAGPGQVSNTVVIRGPDTSVSKNGTDGYCYLTGVSGVSYGGANRAGAARLVRVVVDPSTVTARKISVYVGTGSLPGTPTLQIDVPPEFVNATSFKFGFSAATGGVTDLHEVWGVSVASVNALPTTTITATSAASVTGSAPSAVTYGANPAVTFSTAPTCAAYTDTTYSTPVTTSTPVGTYVTHCSGGVVTGYVLTYVDGVYTVTAAVPASIPTLSEWGMLLLGLLLAGLALRKLPRT